jgi:hypothetical protein
MCGATRCRAPCHPALGEFFRFCNPTVPALVHWALWLRIDHETDEGSFAMPIDRAEKLMEAMIDVAKVLPDIARQMRLAFHEGYGERDPDQLELF